MATPLAANDSFDGVVRTLPAIDYLTRWRIPLGLAAAVLLTLNLVGGDFFGRKQAQYPVVGEPLDPPVAASAADRAPAAPMQAEAMRAAPVMRGAMTAPMPAPPKLDASVWLLKIDGLLKAGQGPAAQQEWTAFRQAYPDYPVDKQLLQRLEQH